MDMAIENGFNPSAFKSLLDGSLHSMPAGSLHPFGDPSNHFSVPIGPELDPSIFSRPPSTAAKPGDAGKAGEGSRPPDTLNPGDPDLAKNRLAQEALLADPAEMRKLFPTLLKDIGLAPNDYLDMAEIDKELQNEKLSQADKNFLTVLKKGYKEFSVTVKGTDEDSDGVSADSLAIINKALNRKLAEDPIYTQTAKSDILGSLLQGAILVSAYTKGNVWERLAGAAGGAVINLALYEGGDWIADKIGIYDDRYDTVEKDFKSFRSNYEHLPDDSSPASGPQHK
jgi:hypothetical protein